MRGIEQIELDNEIVARGFSRKKFLSHYKMKCANGLVEIHIDIDNKSVNYSSTFSINLFRMQGLRFFKDIDDLKALLNRIIKASKCKTTN